MSGFFVSTTWSCIYLQKVATEFQSSKVNLPKYFETYKNRCFTTYLDFVSSPLFAGEEYKKSVQPFLDNFQTKRTKKKVSKSVKKKLLSRLRKPQRFTHVLWNAFKKTAVAYGADLLPFELNGEVVSGLPGHHGHSLENLVLSWARRVVGDDCLELHVLLMFFFLSFTKLKNKKNAALRFILCAS